MLSKFFKSSSIKKPEKSVVHLKVNGNSKGNVLISYITAPFLLEKGSAMPTFHSNYWECFQMAQTFLDAGYNVDVIDYDNAEFIPVKDYSVFIDIHFNMKRLAPLLGANCKKILYATGAHSLFQNTAEYERLLALQKRRNVSLIPRRISPPGPFVEYADTITVLGNSFTESTYQFSNKPIYKIPISSTVEYPFNENKNYSAIKKNFIWIGSRGMVHKGLDLVLDAFAELKDFNLKIFGDVASEEDFSQFYSRELYSTPHIQVMGWMDTDSPKFKEILNQSIGVIYPSCSEGGGGSVVNVMCAGLIPIVSRESSVDIHDFGFLLEALTVESIQKKIQHVSSLPDEELKALSKRTFEFAHKTHSRESYARHFKHFLDFVVFNSVKGN